MKSKTDRNDSSSLRTQCLVNRIYRYDEKTDFTNIFQCKMTLLYSVLIISYIPCLREEALKSHSVSLFTDILC